MKMKTLSLCAVVLLSLVSPSLLASQALADKHGCSWCHDMNRKTVGPAIKQVARQYANNPEAAAMLYDKVIKGGGGPWHGVWGTVPMPPNPNVKAETAKQIVDWMLQQK